LSTRIVIPAAVAASVTNNRRMVAHYLSFRRIGASLVAAGIGLGLIQAAPAAADDYNGLLPVFVTYASGWAPNYSVHPYGLWASRVTPEQIVAERDACQWFNAQYDTLRTQVFGFQNYLADRTDDWSAGGVPGLAGVVKANLDQSAAFLDPRVHTLYITNYPDQSQYSPLYNGDSFYHLWYQLTQISEKIAKQRPAGQINANIATMNVYGSVIRDSGVCNGA
jgi:hypothetical protein